VEITDFAVRLLDSIFHLCIRQVKLLRKILRKRFSSTKRDEILGAVQDSVIDIQAGTSFANVCNSKKYTYCTNSQKICRINLNSGAPSPGPLEIANYLPVGIQVILGWY